jgi:hypothetical protein
MTREGPLLESLTRRLAECPADFLAEPRIGSHGQVHVEAVVADLLRDLGGEPLTRAQLSVFQSNDSRRGRNRLRTMLLACWLLHAPWFRQQGGFAAGALEVVSVTAADLAELTESQKFVGDPDRREELVRMCLKALDLRPAGESEAQAQDRLATLNTAERQRVIRAAREAEERAAQIRAAMAARKAAEAEANLKAMRE